MPRLRYSAPSKEDLKEIARFIANDKPIAARQWVAMLRDKCRLALRHPDIGDDRTDLGAGIRSTYVGSYIIYFRDKDGTLEIVCVLRGDLEFPLLEYWTRSRFIPLEHEPRDVKFLLVLSPCEFTIFERRSFQS